MKKQLVWLVLLLPAATFAAGEEQIRLKDGLGKDLVEANCATCHSLDYIQTNSPFLDRKGWEATLSKMVNAMGAPVPKEDVPKIVEYLDRYYGK
ncbi:MAG: cytochrome c [Pigmentiphaga sp.]